MRYVQAAHLRKIAAGALLALVLTLGTLGLGLPVVSAFATLQSEIEDQRVLLGKLTNGSPLEDRSKILAQRIHSSQSSGVFLGQSSSALSAARLQSILSELVLQQHTRLKSARTLPPRTEGSLQLIVVEANLECSLDELQRILHALSANRPAIAVLGLHIVALSASPDQTGNTLDVRMEVAGIEANRTSPSGSPSSKLD